MAASPPEAVDELLAAGERALHGRAAPARGLTLERVVYESKSNAAGAGGPEPEPGTQPENDETVKTYAVKASEIERSWWLVDASDQTLGRLATRIATLLEGKHKPIYSPHLDTGDHVVVVNAARVRVTGNKLIQKRYYRHSNYPGGLKEESLAALLERKPELVIERAVKGMLPQNRLGRAMFRKLKVYSGGEHPHAAQQPTAVEL